MVLSFGLAKTGFSNAQRRPLVHWAAYWKRCQSMCCRLLQCLPTKFQSTQSQKILHAKIKWSSNLQKWVIPSWIPIKSLWLGFITYEYIWFFIFQRFKTHQHINSQHTVHFFYFCSSYSNIWLTVQIKQQIRFYKIKIIIVQFQNKSRPQLNVNTVEMWMITAKKL